MATTYQIDSPLKVKVSSRKYWILNLNYYRNTHFRVLNNAKIEYKRLLKDRISELPYFNKISLHYEVYPNSERKFDLGNIISIHDKFFLDALVELGRIADDNYTNVVATSYSFGSIDTSNPRVVITISGE
jgi:hypothetical protein